MVARTFAAQHALSAAELGKLGVVLEGDLTTVEEQKDVRELLLVLVNEGALYFPEPDGSEV